MSWLTTSWGNLGITAAKAVLMYLTALIGLRLGERRTLAQWTIIDFAAAVAIGAIVGRTAIADGQSYAVGAVALVALIVIHRLVSVLRFFPLVNKVTDHRIRILVADGRVRLGELRRCGLTENDLFAELRLRGSFSLTDLRYVIYETKGGLSIVTRQPEPPGPAAAGRPAEWPLIERALGDAAPGSPTS